MATRNRNPNDQRDDFLLETNFDDDGALTRVYNSNNNNTSRLANSGGNSEKFRSRAYRSNVSIDRYSDTARRSCCKNCITRIPFATLMATTMLLIGIGVFCGTMYRATSISIIMFDHVFHLKLLWIEAVQMIFVILGSAMAALGFMILFVGFLATGATRHKVYRAWGSRVGGRISCIVFMTITYILQIVWIIILCLLSITTFVFTLFWKMCSKTEVQTHRTCIDLTQFNFLFPVEAREEDMKICEEFEIKAFCKDSVEKSTLFFILATLSSLLIILSLVHYLMCLSANYAHIRDHEKFQELQEIQNLTEMEYTASKDRF
ncbi:unnamed protein product [Diamesa serratosioi]